MSASVAPCFITTTICDPLAVPPLAATASGPTAPGTQ